MQLFWEMKALFPVLIPPPHPHPQLHPGAQLLIFPSWLADARVSPLERVPPYALNKQPSCTAASIIDVPGTTQTNARGGGVGEGTQVWIRDAPLSLPPDPLFTIGERCEPHPPQQSPPAPHRPPLAPSLLTGAGVASGEVFHSCQAGRGGGDARRGGVTHTVTGIGASDGF